MKTYEFRLVLANLTEVSDTQAEALFEAGCDDGTIASRDGQAFIDFARQSASLEEAINSAAADVARAGLKAARVEAECPV
jgi:hypothetical protein